MIKTIFKNYELGRKIGSGGMASLYEAHDTRLNRRVAVKILHPALAQDEDYIARFESEAQQAASLNHRNVVTIHDYGSEDDVYFIVMEFVEGMDVRVALQKQPRFPQEIALAILEETACGLDALHRAGLIHRDMKPANILMSREGEVKIGDFGLAKRTDAAHRLSLTVPGQVLGTLHYMSPEQIVGKEIDARSDIFSLGVTAYEMLTGQRPFDGASYSDVVDKLVSYTPPRLVELGHLVTPAAGALVARMMDKDLTRRCQNMGQVLHDLEAVVESLPDPNSFSRLRRQYLQRFVADPVGFSAELERASVKRFVERGRYYMSLGLGRFDDALAEFRAALALDPDNLKAREALEELTRGRPGEKNVQTEVHLAGRDTTATAAVTESATLPLPVNGSQSGATGAETVQLPKAAPAAAVAASPAARPAGRLAPLRGFLAPKRHLLRWALVASVVLLGAVSVSTLMRPPPAGPALGSVESSTPNPVPVDPAPPVGAPVGPAVGLPGPRLRVNTEPAGADVAYRAPGEEHFVGAGLKTPCELELPGQGRWEIRLTKEGYQAQSQVLTVSSNSESPLFSLTPLVAEAALHVRSRPEGARVRLLAGPPGAGVPAGRFVTPCTISGLREGTWRLRVGREGFVVCDTLVQVSAGVDREVQIVLGPVVRHDGYVRVSVFPPGSLYVDNKLHQREPAKVFLVRLTAGSTHTLEIRTNTGDSYRWNDVRVALGDTLRLPHRRLGPE